MPTAGGETGEAVAAPARKRAHFAEGPPGRARAPAEPGAFERRRAARDAAEAAPAVTLAQAEGRGGPRQTTSGPGSITLVGPGDETAPGEIDVRRAPHGSYGGIFGNPFEMRGEEEREAVVSAYRELLRARTTAQRIAQDFRVRLSGRYPARTTHEKRLTALGRLALRVRRGEDIRIRCACAPRACHGDVIAEWVRKRS